jgi:endonuclease YncB( thermonuclease family)
MFQYSAILEEVIDADTIDVTVDLGFNISSRLRLRLAHIDATRMHAAESEAAKSFLAETLPVGSNLVIRTIKDRRVQYGRYFAEVMLEGADSPPTYINDLIISSGLAPSYEGSTA